MTYALPVLVAVIALIGSPALGFAPERFEFAAKPNCALQLGRLQLTVAGEPDRVVTLDDYERAWKETIDAEKFWFSSVLRSPYEDGRYLQSLLALGFSLSESGVEAPSFAQFLAAYQALGEGGAPKIARVFQDASGKLQFVEFGGGIPANAIELDTGRLSGRDLSEMLSAGFAPLSIFRLRHELGHLISFVHHPEFVLGMRDLFAQYRKPSSPLTAADRIVRGAFAYEALSLVPREHREALREVLGSPYREAGDALVTVSKSMLRLETLSAEALKSHYLELSTFYDSYVQHYGGILNEVGRRSYAEVEWNESLSKFKERASEASYPLWAEEVTADQRNTYLRRFAEFEVAMWESSRTSVQDFLKELAKSEIGPTSPLYLSYVRSGISNALPGPQGEESQGLLKRSLLNQLEGYQSPFQTAVNR